MIQSQPQDQSEVQYPVSKGLSSELMLYVLIHTRMGREGGGFICLGRERGDEKKNKTKKENRFVFKGEKSSKRNTLSLIIALVLK